MKKSYELQRVLAKYRLQEKEMERKVRIDAFQSFFLKENAVIKHDFGGKKKEKNKL